MSSVYSLISYMTHLVCEYQPSKRTIMKGTEAFQQTIKAYLDKRAAEDELFAVSYAKEGKTIEECCNYIFGQVQKSGCCGFTDDEIFGLAVHYYDEDIKKEDCKPVNCKVVVNHHVEISEAEKAEAREKALKQYEAQQLAEIKRKEEEKLKKAKERRSQVEASQPSLFG